MFTKNETKILNLLISGAKPKTALTTSKNSTALSNLLNRNHVTEFGKMVNGRKVNYYELSDSPAIEVFIAAFNEKKSAQEMAHSERMKKNEVDFEFGKTLQPDEFAQLSYDTRVSNKSFKRELVSVFGSYAKRNKIDLKERNFFAVAKGFCSNF